MTVTSPDASVYYAGYNETGLLTKIDVALRRAERDGEKGPTPFVCHIDYNARSQRTLVQYGNGAATTYEYDAETFRLIRLQAVRRMERDAVSAEIFADASRVQDLNYTYDPVGNLTEIADHSLRTMFHRNRKIDPVCDYTYDPLYRLIAATGRENIAQSAFDLAPSGGDYRDYPFVGAGRLNDLQALQQFAEHYEYDPVGNFISLVHRADDRSWTRNYTYREPSLLEPGKHSNRLSRTHLQDDERRGPERYLYDARGNIVQMPHLPVMQWDFMDRLAASARQVVNDGGSETTFYQYDAAGQRVRKVIERRDGARRNERLYVGGVEVFREYDGDGDSIALERETLHVMDDKQRIALVETLTREHAHSLHAPEPVQRYQLANHLGSATLELDEAARLISYEEYAPYGETVYQAGRHAAEVRRKRYRHTGKERDEENGFTYHGARYYAPWLGIWVSCDSAMPGRFNHASVNLYVAVNLNPIRYADRNGHEPVTPTTVTVREATSFWKSLVAKGKELIIAAKIALAPHIAHTPIPDPVGDEVAENVEKANSALRKKAAEQGIEPEKTAPPPDNPPAPPPDPPEPTDLRGDVHGYHSGDPKIEIRGSGPNDPGNGPTDPGGGPGDAGGAEGGGTGGAPPVPGEGGGAGLKRLFRFGGKAMEFLSIATASNEGEAGFAVTLIAVGSVVPGANIVLGVAAAAVLGVAAGRAIYNWWKGPQPTAAVFDIPLPPEQVGPVTHVAQDDPPPPPRPAQNTSHAKDATVPKSLRMRKDKPVRLHFSITKGYDPATGKQW